MTRALLLASWLVAAASLWLARESLAVAVEASAEAREAQWIACDLLRQHGRLLGYDVADDCSAAWSRRGE